MLNNTLKKYYSGANLAAHIITGDFGLIEGRGNLRYADINSEFSITLSKGIKLEYRIEKTEIEQSHNSIKLGDARYYYD